MPVFRVAAAAAAALALTGATAAAAAYPPGRHHAQQRRSLGTVSLTNNSCPNEYGEAVTYGSNDPGGSVQWVQGNGSKVNGCGWWMRVHLHCALPKQGIDDGWQNGGWVTSTVVSGKNCPGGTHWIQFDVQWQHHNRATTYTRQLAP